MTIWTDRWIIFIKKQQITAANGMMIPIDPDTGGDKTFGNLRLSADGQEPRTHSGCSMAATGAMTKGIRNAFEHVPWAKFYAGYEWTWEDALIDAGLQVIEAEDDLETRTITARALNTIKIDATEFITVVKALPAEVWKRITKPPQEW